MTADPFAAARPYPTPLLLLDTAAAAANVAAVRAALPGVDVYYALKCQPHPALVATLADLGVGFEVASPAEVDTLVSLGVRAARMTCLHPIKSPAFVRQLAAVGVTVVAVDSPDEIDKLAALHPAAQAVVRVAVDGTGSRVPLGDKFGCPPEDVVALAQHARRVGLRPAGVTMHVGSQCESLPTWAAALRALGTACDQLSVAGMPPDRVSLGGGLPVPYTAAVPPLDAIGDLVVQRFGPADCRLTVEPGRAIAATAGTLVASVIGTATRRGERWAYLDAGTFHGLHEWQPHAGGLTTPVRAEATGPPVPTRLAGPTCAATDVLPGLFHLPALRPGDRVAFRHAGAYSTALVTPFNGFPPPRVVVVGPPPAPVELV